MISFYPNYFSRDPFSKYSHTAGLGILWGHRHSVCNTGIPKTPSAEQPFSPSAQKSGLCLPAALLELVLLVWGQESVPRQKAGAIVRLTSYFPSLKDLRPSLPVIHFLNTVASYLLARFILVLGIITDLVPDTLLWLEADQSWIFISKHSRRNFKGLLCAFLFYIVNFFITYRAYFIKSFTGRLEFFLKLYVEHNGLCVWGEPFCSLQVLMDWFFILLECFWSISLGIWGSLYVVIKTWWWNVMTYTHQPWKFSM